MFAKAPVTGKVKTRLGVDVGYLRAQRLYRDMLKQTLDMACSIENAEVELWCAPNVTHRFFRTCQERWALKLYKQTKGDLGKRMYAAIRDGLTRAESVVLIGGDCVSLTREHLLQARVALHVEKSAVLGPAEDGGYVLIGMNTVDRNVFKAVDWGTSTVLNTTRKRLRQSKLAWTELPVLWDLDDCRDLARWQRLKNK